MKTTLIAIENDADHDQAKALVGKLMGSRKPDDRVRLVAQARLKLTSADGPTRSLTWRAHAVARHGEPCQ